MSDPTLAERLGAFAAESTFDSLPPEVVDSVRKRVLDVLGISVAAAPLTTSRGARRFAEEQAGRPQSSAVGVPERLPAAQAAFVNGVLAHSLDYDDTHLPSVLHPSACVVPAALAAAEATGADGRATVAAIAVGLEIAVRLGMAGYDEQAGNSLFFEHGQHATSICGTLGGAASAALLYGLGADGVLHALGVSASMAAGLIEANRTGGTVKRMHCGWAAHSAISAARLVAHGFTGPPTVVEGRFGFLRAWLHGDGFPDAVTGGLGHDWAVPGIFFKPYPANHFTHAGIDAALALRAAGLRPEDIDAIELAVPGPNVRTIGQPIEVKRTPATGYMAQFSGPYTVAAALLGGGGLGLGLDDFTDDLAQDPQRRALMQRIDVVADAACDAVFPYQFPAILRVRTTDGRELVQEVMTTRGGPQRPLSYAELSTKFRDNASRMLPPEAVTQLEESVGRLDELPLVGAVLAPLREVDPLSPVD
jgi:2-methylcitrate dehydratase PrpD